MKRFEMGGTDLGETELYLYEITPQLDFLDGLLGIDFFRTHPIYFDFEANKAYVGPFVPNK